MTTQTYLISMCKADGSTPLGQCPEIEIEASDRYKAEAKFHQAYPNHDIVSIGRKSEIEAVK